MKVVLAGGGTAGHVNPAIAIANYIKSKNKNAQILFIGTDDGIEAKLVPMEGYDIKFIKVTGFSRKITPRSIVFNAKAVKYAITSTNEAKKIIKEFKPDFVIGTGGYASFPAVNAASKLGIPCFIHEQNAYPGWTSKVLSKKVKKVFISFDDSKKYFPKSANLIFTGNPVKEKLMFYTKEEARKKLNLDDKPFVLSFGGSLGAREVNKAITDFIVLTAKDEKIIHHHGTGKFGIKWMPDLIKEKGIDLNQYKDIKVEEYIYDMPLRMAASDIIIARAGAITLSEIACLGKPSILIPSPNVTNNHQYYNALSFVKKGAAVMCQEKELSGEKLKDIVYSLLDDKSKLKEMSDNAYSLGVFNALENIYQNIKN